jgi:CRP-like cAMP-binding protein
MSKGMRPKRFGPTVGSVTRLPRGSGGRVLSHVPLFAHLPARDLRRVAGLAEETWFNAGRIVVEEGQPGSSFYVILDGEARVTKGAAGRRIAQLGPGDHFGEMALLDGQPRSATVTAETSLDAVRIRRAAFRTLLKREPDVGLQIMAALAARVRACEKQLLG